MKEKSLIEITFNFTILQLDIETVNNIIVEELKHKEKIVVLENLKMERKMNILKKIGVKTTFLESVQQFELLNVTPIH